MIISDALVPVEVRKAGGTDTYKAALGFESMLLDQLAGQMVEGTSLEDSPFSAQVTQAFGSSLLQGGGVGLAESLYKALRQP